MASSPVTVYWRPGCGYCSRLRLRLRDAGIPVDEVNIWEDPAGAAFVRSVANGNETVPTVTVGDRTFVNPAPRRLIETIGESDPTFVGALADAGRASRWFAVAQWTVIAALIIASFTVEAVGQHGLSWAIDGVAIATYVAFRALRTRSLRAQPLHRSSSVPS